MKQYIKTPTPVEAIQWTGENHEEFITFLDDRNIIHASTLECKFVIFLKNELATKILQDSYLLITEHGEIKVLSSECFESLYTEIQDVELENFVDANINDFAKSQLKGVKYLGNTDSNVEIKNVKDIQFWGDIDTFQLISEASSENEGFMKSVKAMEIKNIGCVVQTTTQQRNPDGSYALTDAVTFVPQVRIEPIMEFNTESGKEKVVGRKLVSNYGNGI